MRLSRLVIMSLALLIRSRFRFVGVGLACLSMTFSVFAKSYVPQGRAMQLDGDISWEVRILDEPDERACAYLVFEYHDPHNYRALKLSGGAIFLVKVEGGTESFLGTGVPFELYRWERYQVTIRRRATSLSVIVDGIRCLEVTDPTAAQAGSFGYCIEPRGGAPWFSVASAIWTEAPWIHMERRFAMESRAAGNWEVVRGAWQFQDSREPAALRPAGRFIGRQGLALIGENTWDDYAARVAVRVGGPGASAGLVFYYTAPNHYYLLRLVGQQQANSHPAHLRLELVKVKDGQETLLKARPTRLSPEQWCELKVAIAADAVKAYVDGQFAFLAYDEGLIGGKTGLYAEGPVASYFDELTVWSLRLTRAEFLEDREGRAVQFVAPSHDSLETESRQALATKRSEWRKEEVPDGVLFETIYDYWGNVALSWKPRRPMMTGASATLVICAEEGVVNSGYAFNLLQGEDTTLTLRFLRAGREVGAKQYKCNQDRLDRLSVALARSGSLITAQVNGEPVYEFSDPEPLVGGRLRFHTDLPFTDAAQELCVMNANSYTENFQRAPVNWLVGAGRWEIVSGAESRAFIKGEASPNLPHAAQRVSPAILWAKGAYGGDVTLEYEASCIGASPDGPFPPNLNAVICADGRNLASGYCVIFSPTSYPGQPGWPIRLIREGKVVAETKRFLYEDLSPSTDVPERPAPIGGWWRLRLQKRGELLRFFVNDRLALEYRDRSPLRGSRVGLWTLGTPMAISQVRIAWSQTVAQETLFAPPPSNQDNENHSVDDAVKVRNNQCGGAFRCALNIGPVLVQPPAPSVLQFDLKADSNTAINLYFQANGKLCVVPLTGPAEHPPDVSVLRRVRPDGKPGDWQSITINLTELLERNFKSASVMLTDLWLGQASTNWRLAAGLSGNRLGASYWVRRIRMSDN